MEKRLVVVLPMETAIKFVKKPSSYIVCTICGKVFTDPVINVKCGHTFCLRCVEATGVRRNSQLFVRCPEDGNECKLSELVVNRYKADTYFLAMFAGLQKKFGDGPGAENGGDGKEMQAKDGDRKGVREWNGDWEWEMNEMGMEWES